MIITTDKVYYNGKEFIVNQWPELKAHTTRSIEEGYVVQDKVFTRDIEQNVYRIKTGGYLHPNDWKLRIGFHTLPELREFECGCKVHGQDICNICNERTAILLTKKEVKDSVRVEEQQEELIYSFQDMMEFGKKCIVNPSLGLKENFKDWIRTRKPRN